MRRDCTTCAHHKYLQWLDTHLCKLPKMGGTIDKGDIHNEGCPEWTPIPGTAYAPGNIPTYIPEPPREYVIPIDSIKGGE